MIHPCATRRRARCQPGRAGAARCARSAAAGTWYGRARCPRLAGLVVAASAFAAAAQAQHRYVATPVGVLERAGAAALRMPTDVAVGPDGVVFVADGVNHRVVEFDARGGVRREVRRAGDRALSRPIGIDVDRAGRLWIADTGHARIVAIDAAGAMLHEITLRAPRGAHPTDVTDVAVSADGSRVWFADNDGHQVGYVHLDTGEISRFGERGESLGQLAYPFLLDATPTGDVLVTDVINARVQTFSAAGRPAGAIGSYGVELGQLYRPKGLAADAEGNVWIADGTLGVVQVFRATGGFIDAVRDADGAPLKLESPVGLALGPDGSLYVAELSADRVRKFSIAADPAAPRVAPPPAPRTAQPRTCTACHLEWMEPLVGGRATLLIEPPSEVRGDPSVARADRCLSCHDGSVADSRRTVWVDHGHRRDAPPPPGMSVPAHLPLVAGRIACRTCHSAHTRGGAGETIAEAVFLRVQENPVELCLACHADLARVVPSDAEAGAALRSHPMGRMELALPEALRAAGAPVAADAHDVTCTACHRGHSPAAALLLPVGDSSSALCVSCHEPMRAGARRWREDPHAAVTDCTDCHRMHDAGLVRFLLPEPRTLCLDCHAGHQSFAGGPHDLAASSADAWPEASRGALGGCLACHAPHPHAPGGEFRAGIAAGLPRPDAACVACHPQAAWGAEGRAAAVHPRIGADLAVPHGLPLTPAIEPGRPAEIGCGTCHDPHAGGTRGGGLLRIQAEAAAQSLCLECHADARHIGWTGHASATLARAGLHAAACTPCHSVHADPRSIGPRFLWPAHLTGTASPAPDAVDDALCIACHRAGGHAPKPEIASHPPMPMIAAGSADATDALPLFNERGEAGRLGRITCRTCHVAHGRDVMRGAGDDAALAELSPAERRARRAQLREFAPPNLCTSCHGFDGLRRFLYFHDPRLRGALEAPPMLPSIWRPRG